MAISFGVPFNFGKLESIWQVFYIPMNGGAYVSALAHSQDGGYQSWEWHFGSKKPSIFPSQWLKPPKIFSENQNESGVPNKSTVKRAIMHPAAGSTVPIYKFIHLDTIPGASWNQHHTRHGPWSRKTCMFRTWYPWNLPWGFLFNIFRITAEATQNDQPVSPSISKSIIYST